MAHTPLSPAKNGIRRDWLKKVPIRKDIITISHGAFDVLNILEWKGRIQPCDIDDGVRDSIHYMITPTTAGVTTYPDLNILPSGGDVLSTVSNYCARFGTSDLGAVDIDLACGVLKAWWVMKPILDILIQHRYRGRVILTFTNHRDSFKSLSERIVWLEGLLPAGVKMESHRKYESSRIGEYADRQKGSSMCCVVLKHG